MTQQDLNRQERELLDAYESGEFESDLGAGSTW